MAKFTAAITNFNAGQLSKYMEGRVDVQKYSVAAYELTNFMCMVEGPAMRHPGARYVIGTKTAANRVWLRKFEFSNTQAFQVEFGDFYCRFYTNHGQISASGAAAYAGGTTYSPGQAVVNGGLYYTCIATTTGNAPPNATYWYPLTGTVYEIPSPYALADLTNSEGAFSLQTEQSADVLYIAGAGKYPPQTLTRYGSTQWAFAPYAPVDGPFLDPNSSPIAVWLETTGTPFTYTLKSTAPLFAATDVYSGGSSSSRLVRLQVQSYNIVPWASQTAYVLGDQVRAFGNTYRALNGATSGPTAPSQIAGTAFDGKGGVQWLYVDSGYGIGAITAYTNSKQVTITTNAFKDFKPSAPITFPTDVFGTSNNITAITQANPCVVTVAGTYAIGDPVFITGVVGMTQINDQPYVVSAFGAGTITLAGIDSTTFTAYASGGQVINKATTRFQLGAWSASTEYPRAVGFFADRLWWGGAVRLWGSVPASYTSQAQDFQAQVTTDSAISVILSEQEVASIKWLKSSLFLLVGTDGGEFGLQALVSTQALGPGNVDIQPQSTMRCRGVAAQKIGTQLFYVQRAGRKVLAMDYNFYLNRYESTNQNQLAYSVTKQGIIDMAWQAEPFRILWCVLSDGTLVGYTYDRQDQVTGWHRHVMGGGGAVESVSVTPAPDGSRDEVWMIVRRTINGVTVRSVEYLEKHYDPDDGDVQSSVFYGDMGATYSGAPTSTVSGLTWLANQTVQVIADGAAHPDVTISAGGVATLSVTASVVQIGFNSTARLVTPRLEGGADVGTSQGKIKRTHKGAIRFVDTLGGYFGMYNSALTTQALDEVQFRYPSVPMGSPPATYTGDVIVNWPGQSETDGRLCIEQRQMFPMTVAGIFPNMVVSEYT